MHIRSPTAPPQQAVFCPVMNESLKAELETAFDMKDAEERLELFVWMRHRWCQHCGDEQPADDNRGCQCSNDE